MRIVYFSVTRVSRELERLPVQMVGSGYHRSSPANVRPEDPDVTMAENRIDVSQPAAEAPSALTRRVRLPVIMYRFTPVPQDDPTNCSSNGGCGWFTPEGRMVSYIPFR
jgi:hypothetical protein